MIRVARPGAVIAVYVWDFAGEMQMLRRFWDAAVALDPEARSLDHGTRYPVCAPEPLRKLMADCGASGVEVLTIDVPTVFKDFDDYWSPFMRGHGAAPEYCASLGEERRAALRERLRSSLPTEVDGRVRMIARAFAVHGTKPA
jgi:hypothetical protein